MDLTDIIRPGMTKEGVYFVAEEHTAAHIGSGSMRVLATPWMIAYIERVARDFLGERLPEGYSSVGVRVDVQHLAPTPVGSRVTARAVVLSVDGVRVNFAVETWDEQGKVGEGQHLRVVIDEERFLRRVAARGGIDRSEATS